MHAASNGTYGAPRIHAELADAGLRHGRKRIAQRGSVRRSVFRLPNLRYTGRQVWNRARTDEVLIDVDDVALGHLNRHR